MEMASTVWDAHLRLAELAARQYGAFGYRQLSGCGVSDGQLRHLMSRGVVTRVGPQVYRMAGTPASWHGDLQIGLLSLGPDAVVSHQAAAKLHGFDRFRRDVLEFTVRRRRRGAEVVEATVHTSLVMPRMHVTVIDGLRVTTPDRTIVDLAGQHIKTVRLEAAIDSALRLGVTDVDKLVATLRMIRGKGRRGVRRLDRLLLTTGGHSVLERAFLQIVDCWGFPSPATQVVHERNGEFIARVDFLFPAHGIVVEVSGGRGHSSAADRAKDARRRNGLQDLGRRVLEFTYEDVMERESYVVRTLSQSFKSRSPRRLAG